MTQVVKLPAIAEFKPIRTPNYILWAQGTGGIAVKDLNRQAIEILCKQFKKDMLKKAGLEDI